MPHNLVPLLLAILALAAGAGLSACVNETEPAEQDDNVLIQQPRTPAEIAENKPPTFELRDPPERPAPAPAPSEEQRAPQPRGDAMPRPNLTPRPTPQPAFTEAFPGVFVNAADRVVEVYGFVPIDTRDPETPHVYLEVVACAPDSKEHEALFVAQALPSHMHAALLLIGLEPGSPGQIGFDGTELVRIPPTGDPVDVALLFGADDPAPYDPLDLAVHVDSGQRMSEAFDNTWIFAGSRLVDRRGGDYYDADGTGLIVGLTTFGSEVIAPTFVLSPDSPIDDPAWIADVSRVPPAGTPARLRISARD